MGWNVGKRRGDEPADHDRVEALAGVPALAGCTPEQLRQIAALGTEVRRGPDTVLARAGAPVRQGLVILEGVVAEHPTVGRERAVSVGHFVGAEALAQTHAASTTTTVALTDVRLLVFGPLELPDVAALAAARGERQAPRPAPAPARRRVLEPAWGLASPAVA
jgi:hypothetical protein